MSWLPSIALSFLSGVTGLVLSGLVANACVSWYRVSNFEGKAGFFVVFIALGGGLAAAIIGLIIARLVAAGADPGFPKALGITLGATFGIAGVAALLCRLGADVAPTWDRRELNLEVEFRFPKSSGSEQPPTVEGAWLFRLAALDGNTQRTYRDGSLAAEGARREADRWIVPATAPLFTARGGRLISLQHNQQEEAGFLLSLPGHPEPEFESWSEWLPHQQENGQPWPDDRLSYRFRVTKVPLPPPPKTEAEHRAEVNALQEAEFNAIPPDAPVQRWFPYIEYRQPLTERALSHIASRPGLASELGSLATAEDARLAEMAMRCIEMLPAPTAEFNAPVAAAGRDIAARLRAVVATPVEKDPGYDGAADISIRFNGWLCAARKLRGDSGGDFTGELQAILVLSRERPDSHALRMDVCRVASYYLHQWAGIEPLPTDPKPK
ncbi:MAG: hypothetical protein JNK37_18020 [Verrucomicrobiales bacterium]|nr:hypothetical protein [Verrucomicrobiales bacterium]